MQSEMLYAMAGMPGGDAPAAGGAAAAGGSGGFMSLLPLVIIFVLFYFLFIMPQRKQQKQHEALLKQIKKGDEVVTTGGIFGSVAGFDEKNNTVFLKLAENVKIEIQRSSISGLRQAPVTAVVDTKKDAAKK